VSEALASAIEQRYPDTTHAIDIAGVTAELSHDGETFRARIEPATISIELPATDGFDLALRWTDRGAGSLASSFDDSCYVETNDVALASMWLDRDAQAALLASRYTSGIPEARRNTAPLLRDGTWQHAIRSDHVIASRDIAEDSVDRIVEVLGASLALAGRPARWARWFQPLGKALGCEVAGRIELGGRPVLRQRRGGTEVTVRLLRRLGPEDAGRFRMVVGAHRVASAGETLTLIHEDLPRAAWPPPNDLASSSLRIDARARTLLDAARPSTTIVRRHDVEITFDGVFADVDRLSAAIQLAGYWASDQSQDGPYR
jgi:hypothetical protein